MEDVWIVPKNIRQIGESHSRISIYIEDYAATFVSQFVKSLGACARTGVCYGRIYEEAERVNIVIEGIAVDLARIESADEVFSEESYRRAEKEGMSHFAGKKVIGKLIADTEIQRISDARMSQLFQSADLFGTRIELVLVAGKEDGIRSFFVSVRGAVEKVDNYYIYYDKNEEMQSYLIGWNEGLRGLCEERKAQIKEQEEVQQIISAKKKEPFPFLECAACFLLVAACAIGVVSINNYQRMQNVEKTIQNMARDFYGAEDATPVMGSVAEPDLNGRGTREELSGADDSGIHAEDLPVYVPQSEREEQQSDSEDANPEEEQPEIDDAESIAMPTVSPLPEPTMQPVAEPTIVPTVGAESVETQTVSYQEYIVKQGDTLSSICYAYYQDRSRVDEVCRLNGISDPDTLAVGQKILLP